MPKNKQRTSNGGGWSTGPEMIQPGYLVNHQYSGPGKDCVNAPVRSGFMNMYSQHGLPGLSGGKRSKKRSNKRSKKGSKKHHGGTMLQPAPFEDAPQISAPGVPPQPVQQPAQPVQQPAQPVQQAAQKGGRYGFFPEMGPLNPINAVGASGLAPFARIPCEAGTFNSLNPDVKLQMATTAVPMRGGACPVVNVGAADSMRYNAPTAGYRNDFEPLPAGGAVPGLMLQTPYDARSGNMACATTGGSRRRSHVRFGGAQSVAAAAAPYSQMQMNQVMNRAAFDGSKGGLPVKYGGSRKRGKRTRRNRKQRKSRKARKSFWGF